jgi:hypothetical protein
MNGHPTLAAERELLVAQCELDRLELALAWYDLRRAARPRELASTHPWLGRALKLALPVLGMARARRASRYLSLALLAWRVVGTLKRR